MKLGIQRQRARDRDALALSAGELVRIVAHLLRPQPDALEQLRDALAARSAPSATPCTRSGSPTMSPARMRGLSDENGSWNTICICRRSGRSRALRRAG